MLAARLAVETSPTVINLCRQGEVPVFGPDRLVAHQHLEALVDHLTNLLHPGEKPPNISASAEGSPSAKEVFFSVFV